ncbi:PREDICTED: uncharacterized protein LOC100641573 [Amphimedon queenslandica]|uniref:3-ketoacyl-[acyl-carrier-protein] reductase beta subunit n=1 Tax=Amphimedon queenslandica TaxID=400682 RepID=A0A1X7SYD8_AMPQE|nr:PREDICTED: uncharacterized protein LOC100641573 [Amphimedon queenslandica]|eukprot:XP_003391436.1 PREDICTED: uncharacterized protein LOC100641573 [Amphimedon queenslandica]
MSSGRKAVIFFASGGLLATMAYISRRRSYKKQAENIPKSETAGKRLKFTNKTVLITGGAGNIGAATAHAFAKEGATLVLVDLPRLCGKMREARKGLLLEGAKEVHVLGANVSNSQDVQRMVSEAVSVCGRIDCFFNNAGIQGEMVPLHEQSNEEFQTTIQVNLYGVFLGMKYVSRAMMMSDKNGGPGGGVIVNTASMAGLIGPGNMAAYAASKFGVVGLTKTGAKDLAPHNIRVVAIAPGLVEGYMWDRQVRLRALFRKRQEGTEEEPSEREIKEQEARMLAATPLGRVARLSEIAEVVVFLCSESASYITGSVIPIEGGRLQ